MAMQLDTSILDRISGSKVYIEEHAFAVLPSVSSKEKIVIVLQRKRVSTCTDVMDGYSLEYSGKIPALYL